MVSCAAMQPIRREFRQLLADGYRLVPAGEARHDPGLLDRYRPQHVLELFDYRIFLSRPRKNPSVRFFVAYVVPPDERRIYPRIFYKDLSLVWRSASHLVATEDEFWIGKGAVRTWSEGGYEHRASDESTTDLPLEIQDDLERINKSHARVPFDERALFLVLRNAPAGRIEPYRDFMAARDAERLRIHGGRSIARFTRRNDPSSLRFTKGFEPDFGARLERSRSSSRLYGGTIWRYRFASTNRKIQWLFMAAPKHVWIIPPQAMTTQLSSYAVRTVDVIADDDLFVPGYEYHYEEEDGSWVSQIPEGFVGPQTEFDPTRADASAWLDALPVVREFRRAIGGGPKRTGRARAGSRPRAGR